MTEESKSQPQPEKPIANIKEEEKSKKRIPYFNVDKKKRIALSEYINNGILEKFPETPKDKLLTKSNIMKNMSHDDVIYPLYEVCVGLIKVIANKYKESLTQKLWTPHIIIVEPDTYSVIAQYKEIIEIVNSENFSKEVNAKVRIHQLFSKHKKIDLQVKQLAQVDKEKNILNVIISTPNRLIKLAELNALDYSELKYVILDCTKNMKKQTLLDYRDTRDDTMNLFGKYFIDAMTKNKVKIYFH